MDWSDGMDNGMYSWWHHCVLDSFIPSSEISKNLLYHMLSN